MTVNVSALSARILFKGGQKQTRLNGPRGPKGGENMSIYLESAALVDQKINYLAERLKIDFKQTTETPLRYVAFDNPKIFWENPDAKGEIAVFNDLDVDSVSDLVSGVYVEIYERRYQKYFVDGFSQRNFLGHPYFNESVSSDSYKTAVLWALEYIEQAYKFLNVSVLANTISDKARLLGKIRRTEISA